MYGEHKANMLRLVDVDEGRKRVLAIVVGILAARKLTQFDGGKKVPATMSAIADAVRWADSLTFLKGRACNGGLPAAAFKQQLTYPPLVLKSSEKETNHHGQNAGSGFR